MPSIDTCGTRPKWSTCGWLRLASIAERKRPHTAELRRLDSVTQVEYANGMSEVKPVVFRAVRCTLEVIRPRQGVVLLRFTGPDVGEFGEAPFQELANDLQRSPSIQLFVDAGNCSGASIDVSSDWARWMSANRERTSTLHILCGSRFIQLTADFVRRFTGFEERMRIYTERTPFEMALREQSV